MLIEIIILILGIPVGYLISWLAKDELIEGRKWFKIVIIASFILGVWFFLTDSVAIAFTLFFICIFSFVSYHKSFDKKWTKKKV